MSLPVCTVCVCVPCVCVYHVCVCTVHVCTMRVCVLCLNRDQVYEGIPILSTWEALPLAGKAIHK